ncbi:hypothetical protein quinque_010056 [Culex quinquefasciatus]
MTPITSKAWHLRIKQYYTDQVKQMHAGEVNARGQTKKSEKKNLNAAPPPPPTTSEKEPATPEPKKVVVVVIEKQVKEAKIDMRKLIRSG